jgi:hypothetical protein
MAPPRNNRKLPPRLPTRVDQTSSRPASRTRTREPARHAARIVEGNTRPQTHNTKKTPEGLVAGATQPYWNVSCPGGIHDVCVRRHAARPVLTVALTVSARHGLSGALLPSSSGGLRDRSPGAPGSLNAGSETSGRTLSSGLRPEPASEDWAEPRTLPGPFAVHRPGPEQNTYPLERQGPGRSGRSELGVSSRRITLRGHRDLCGAWPRSMYGCRPRWSGPGRKAASVSVRQPWAHERRVPVRVWRMRFYAAELSSDDVLTPSESALVAKTSTTVVG